MWTCCEREHPDDAIDCPGCGTRKGCSKRPRALHLTLKRRALWPCVIVAPVAPAGGTLRRYVNREPHPKIAAFGSVLEVVVGARGDAARAARDRLAREGDELFVSCRFTRTSARTTPRPGFVEDGGATDTIELDGGRDLSARVRVGPDGLARCRLELGKAGGETVTIGVARTRGGAATSPDAEVRVETWRRCYYQITRPARVAAPSTDALVKAFEEVAVELRPVASVVLSPDAAPGASIGRWYPGDALGLAAGPRYLVVGDAHGDALRALRARPAVVDGDPDEDVPQELLAHFVLCDLVADVALSWKHIDDAVARGWASVTTAPDAGRERPTRVRVLARKAATRDVVMRMFGATSDGDLPVSDVLWQVSAKYDPARASRSFDLAAATVSFTGATGAVIDIDVSKDEAFRAAFDASQPLSLRFVFEEAVAYMGGAFGSPRREVLVSLHDAYSHAALDAREIAATLAHEMAHTLDMVVAPKDGDDPGYSQPGLDPATHGRRYMRSGPHCADGLTDEQFAAAVEEQSKDESYDWQELPDGTKVPPRCKCLMYGYSHPARGRSFCGRCRPFLLGHALDALG